MARDALAGSDGTGDPISRLEPVEIWADPLADAQSLGTSSMTSSLTAPDAITRVPGPPPMSNEAVLAAEQQLAREQAEQRSSAQTAQRLADRTRRDTLDRARLVAQQRAAAQATTRAGQQAQVAAAYRGRTSAQMTASNAPTAPPAAAPSAVNPAADRAALLQRLRSTTGQERKQVMRELVALGRANRAAGGKKTGSGLGCALVLIVLFLGGTGAGRELIGVIADWFSSGR